MSDMQKYFYVTYNPVYSGYTIGSTEGQSPKGRASVLKTADLARTMVGVRFPSAPAKYFGGRCRKYLTVKRCKAGRQYIAQNVVLRLH